MAEEKKELVEETKETTNEGVKELTEDELLAKKKKNMMIISIGLVVLLILLMIGGYFLFIKDDEVPLAAGEGDPAPVSTSISSAEPEPVPSTTAAEEPEPEHVHIRGEWTVVREATCTEDGSEEEICPECKEVLDEREIPAIPHKWKDVTEVVKHEAEIGERWVQDREAYDEEVTDVEAYSENMIQCSCGTTVKESEWNSHISGGTCGHDNLGVTTVNHPAQTHIEHHEAEGHWEEYVEKEAWEETVVVGQRCTECGATR